MKRNLRKMKNDENKKPIFHIYHTPSVQFFAENLNEYFGSLNIESHLFQRHIGKKI